MKSVRIKSDNTSSQFPGKQRSYQDIVAYLDANWKTAQTANKVERMQTISTVLGLTQNSHNAIMICGTNGKSLTTHFTTQLLQSEGLTVGSLVSPHVLTYNERIMLNGEQITNRTFADLGNAVLDAAEEKNLTLASDEALTAIALLYFKDKNADVLVVENETSKNNHPVTICDAKVVVVTRVTAESIDLDEASQDELIKDLKSIIKKDSHVVSGDQLKAHLQLLEKITEEQGGIWEMPIRKVAPLAYPFEQIHGRCAALAERASMLYMNNWGTENTTIVADSILVKQKGKRGRPTLEAKKQEKLNPKKTVEQFWKETDSQLSSRFEILKKEAPEVLLDSADNLDALENVFLGTRLLHYQRPISELVLIMAAEAQNFNAEELARAVRYFFKKTPGQIFICPLENDITPWNENQSWDISTINTEMTNKKIKASAFKSFAKAFEAAKSNCDSKTGLILITGSSNIVTSYWKNRNIKKLF